jgi:hypothetical protein
MKPLQQKQRQTTRPSGTTNTLAKEDDWTVVANKVPRRPSRERSIYKEISPTTAEHCEHG